jgi:hypothetical protein
MRSIILVLLLLASCATNALHATSGPEPTRPVPPVKHWGAMRTVLREGRTEGRVELAEVVGANSVAVGALEGLAGEITVLGHEAHVAQVTDANSPDGLRTRLAAPGDRATLLVAAEVAEWSEHALDAVADLDSLEEVIGAIARANGIPTGPFPFRIEGLASHLALHVLDRSCPVASPDGPSPWRFSGEGEPATLVGFYAEDSAGVLTHHGQSTHCHAILAARGVSGHVDEVSFGDGARLYLPVR